MDANQRKRTVLLLLLGALLVSAAWLGTVILKRRWSGDGDLVDWVCNKTLHPKECVSTLAAVEGANPKDFAHITVKESLYRLQQAYRTSLEAAPQENEESPELMASEDCDYLFEEALDHINRSLTEMGGLDVNPLKAQVSNVKTWLSAALTDVETCLDGFRETSGTVREDLEENYHKFTKSLSNALATIQIFFPDNDRLRIPLPLLNRPYRGIPIPWWLYGSDRRLFQVPPFPLQVNATVAQDGSGQYQTIGEAIMNAPSYSSERYVIYVKAGIYDENVLLPMNKTNVMLLGDGRGKTIVASRRNVKDGSTTYRSATFAVSGKGFIARDMTFTNSAGPDKQQAVALRVGADMSAFYRCNFIGFQDTLYVHSLRQFYRECDIYGTVDIIMGNAAAVFQNCNIIVRTPMPNQTNTITAQGRSDPFQNTGISIQNCTIVASRDLAPVKSSFPTYLGRPWKLFSRTVVMESFLGNVIHPAGWLQWSGDYGLEGVYFREYMNTGPGSKMDGREGGRVIRTAKQANSFTVDSFISGSDWLPPTSIPFNKNLTMEV
ncbi:hypothetical protein SUGI_0284890 [Cryptomeria japonica]|uniref:pectinesterase n=1 Tax=Cryptomeria japonica TaxID=3369 RepID=UPI0024089480|nr:pectinesterase [Cryptomeria japonica]GLJ16610.1 hypothetical protein SUGI_0284890 [Cryptomeria japonica]